MHRTLALMTTLSAAALTLVGCAANPLGSQGSDDAGLESSMDSNYGDFFDVHYESMEGAVYAGDERDGDVDAAFEPEDGNATLPVAWGRQPTGPLRRLVETFYPDPRHAETTIRRTMGGRLYIDRSDDGIRNPGVKGFVDNWKRSSRFARIEDDEWRLTALTPATIRLANIEDQTVYIESVDIWVDGEQMLSIDDPSIFLAFPADLPFAEPGQVLRVEAAVGNTDQTWTPAQWVYLHTQGRRVRDWGSDGFNDDRPIGRRFRMADNGERGDRIPGDGIYTIELELGGDRPLARVVVDVMASSTLMTEFGDDYNSTAWAIPFLVHAPWDE